MRRFCKSNYKYQEFFCEENIWWLGKSLHEEGFALERQHVLIFSNAKQTTPLFCQGENLLVWDYHVVLYYEDLGIFDFNTLLPFPCEAERYFACTFPQLLPEDYRVYVRKVAMEEYHEHFCSDRSHMLDKDGTPVQPFPSWAAICHKRENVVLLKDYIDFSQNCSSIIATNEFVTRFVVD
ncbi:hypothetical protein [Candidatus Uabimicrobium amorphum]|uniref:Protein N-terminal glutamine amidohydrolase n=1 Tax=Uabimicrobium amorphum TaxID=2596890 RepID=A0A5S9ITW5_UABAM|nr:hypothetical protein [Candidatus Uabimicrobium amorphum]BBM88009.1 hypothetical protein UABAM_06425 [Candidatus Uabimicrobium amorphum]